MSDLKDIKQYKILKDIKKLSILQTNLFDIESEKFGLTNGEYSFLFSILNNPGITLKELSEKELSNKSLTTRVVKKLLKKDLIKKRLNNNDKRSYKLYFNESKSEFLESLRRAAMTYSTRLLKGFREEEKELFERFLESAFMNVSEKY